MKHLPQAILFDLDDTILSAYSRPHLAWIKVAEQFATALAPLEPVAVATAITAFARAFWADPVQHKHWRFRPTEARQRIVAGGFAELGTVNGSRREVIDAMAARFTALREEEMHVFPGACETLDRLKELGVRLALVTNGPAEVQRKKLTRFSLERHFDHIQIEGEHGFGKPEERAYTHAMASLGVAAEHTWMVGDNLEWEVAGPQLLGIYAVWHDPHDLGLPPDSPIRPDRIIRSLPELL
jgi:putative hydrolase of the HAD superfamily